MTPWVQAILRCRGPGVQAMFGDRLQGLRGAGNVGVQGPRGAGSVKVQGPRGARNVGVQGTLGAGSVRVPAYVSPITKPLPSITNHMQLIATNADPATLHVLTMFGTLTPTRQGFNCR